ncbi:MAG: helix-turn-helix transcriptional regulator [Polyangiaceae bacterium]|nr:helix-turn-helix transcriptional regulator [Polyangiaceae bacterium]
MQKDASEARRTLGGALLFLTIGAVIGSDLLADYLQGAGLSHVALEGLVLVLALAGGLAFSRRWVALRRAAEDAAAEARDLRTEAAAQRAEAERWRAEARDLIEGLAAAIDRQFDRWSLSPAEREVGLLLLKGLSHQEVAELRGVSERTVRQQAQALYKKAGLSGRAELSAYFLEDLLGPRVTAAEASR